MLGCVTASPNPVAGGDHGAVWFGLLGPFEFRRDGRTVLVTSGRLRGIIAVLASSAGQTVSLDAIGDYVWGDEPPNNVRRTVQTWVARLRAMLPEAVVASRPGGYALDVQPGQVDVLRFEALLDEAAAVADGQIERKLLGQALGLWRGAPFLGVEADALVAVEAPRLTERYLSALERAADLALAAGETDDAIGRLRDEARRHPLRESLWARHLRSLVAAGRTAEALAAYEEVRLRLVDELGADPGPELQRLHAELLGPGAESTPAAGDADVPAGPSTRRAAAGAGAIQPRQLPADVAFVGRSEALAALDDAFAIDDPDASGTVLVAVTGQGGSGKTALAVHWAHRRQESFADGQLFVDLRGFAARRPLQPLAALGELLSGLGVPADQVPAGLDARAALYRTLLADRRTLVVLDNVRDSEQVRPLLPGTAGRVLVTSRNALRGLSAREGARRVVIDRLPAGEAVALLTDRLRRHGLTVGVSGSEPAATTTASGESSRSGAGWRSGGGPRSSDGSRSEAGPRSGDRSRPGDGSQSGDGSRSGDGSHPGEGPRSGDGSPPHEGPQSHVGPRHGGGSLPGEEPRFHGGPRPGEESRFHGGPRSGDGSPPGHASRPDDGSSRGEGRRSAGGAPRDGGLRSGEPGHGATSMPGGVFRSGDALRPDSADEAWRIDEPTVGELAELCEQLPLALLIAAEYLARHRDRDPATLVRELRDGQARMEALDDIDDGPTASVRAVISWSYAALHPEPARVFRYLGWVTPFEFGADFAASVVDSPVADVRRLLDHLADLSLVVGVRGRYRFHDLVRVYAALLADAVDEPEVLLAAGSRGLDWYVHSVHNAADRLRPSVGRAPLRGPSTGIRPMTFADHESAWAWCRTERRALMFLIPRLADFGRHQEAWQLAWDFGRILLIGTAYQDERIEIAKAGVAAAAHLDDAARYIADNNLGNAYHRGGAGEQAAAALRKALAGARAAGDAGTEAAVLMNLGITQNRAGDLEAAVETYQASLVAAARWERSGATAMLSPEVAACHLNLGNTLTLLGRYDESIAHAQESLELSRRSGNRIIEGMSLGTLAEARLRIGDLDVSAQHAAAATTLLRELGATDGLVNVLLTETQLKAALHRHDEARAAYDEGVGLLGTADDPRRDRFDAALRS